MSDITTHEYAKAQHEVHVTSYNQDLLEAPKIAVADRLREAIARQEDLSRVGTSVVLDSNQ